jgi:hypothetical protein
VGKINQLSRLFSIFFGCSASTTPLTAKEGNVDEEYMNNSPLTMTVCWQNSRKKNIKESANLKLGFQEILEKGL